MKLTSIARIILNEAPIKSPLQLIRSAISKLGKSASVAEDALLKAIKNEEGNIRPNLNLDDIRDIDSDLVNRAIKRAEFAAYRPLITAKFYSKAKKDKIDDIVGKLERKEITPSRSIAELNALGVPPVFQKEVRDLSKKSIGNTPTPAPNPIDVPPLPIPDDVNGFVKFLQGLKLSGYEYLIKNFGWMNKTFKEKYYQNLGDINALQQEFNNLATNVLLKVDPKNPKMVNEELSKMVVILGKVGYRKELNLKTIWDSWKAEMPTQFVKDLKTWENPKFQQLVSYFENIDGSKIKNAPLATYTKMEGIVSLFTKRESVLNKLQRIGFTMTHLDPRTISEMGNSIKIYGFWRSVGKGLGQKLILGFVVFPTYYSILKTSLDYLDLHRGINLGIGNKEDIKNFDVEQNVWGNLCDMISTSMSNFINTWPIIGNDYAKLIAWSPLLWVLDKDRYSNLTPEQAAAKIRETLPKVQEEKDNNKKEVKDAVNQDPSLIDNVKNEWNDLIGDSTTKKKPFVNPFQ